MGELRINLTNFITIGLMAFVFCFIAKKALSMAGLHAPAAAGQ